MLNSDEISIAIETSCDDTSIALFRGIELIEMKTISSIEEQQKFGGVVPEIASRSHLDNIHLIFDYLIVKNKINPKEISNIFCTNEPGLPGSLHIGILFAKTLSYLLNAKLYFINHLYAHIFSAFINNDNDIKFPFLSLVVSGGNTILYKVNDYQDITVINETVDDSVGEVYDKVSRALGMSYPGGPCIDKLYNFGESNKIQFIKKNSSKESQFSFSGLKTSVLSYINTKKMKKEDLNIEQIASSFQKTIIDILISKVEYYSQLFNINYICLGGGVSANSLLRSEIKKIDDNFRYPELKYTGDNACMIGFYGLLLKKEGRI